MTAMDHDYNRMLWEETSDIAKFLEELSDDDLDVDSLCEGWRVRDVAAHMAWGHTAPLSEMLSLAVRNRLDVDKASKDGSIAFADNRSSDDLKEVFSGVARNHTRRGIARFIPGKMAFTDHLIHHQDMRRPLDRQRDIPEERLVAALDVLPKLGTIDSNKRARDLRLRATDADWTHGDGPEVSGPAEALIMALGGRPAALDDLSGEGLDTLSARV